MCGASCSATASVLPPTLWWSASVLRQRRLASPVCRSTRMAAFELMRICTWPTDFMRAVTSHVFPIAVAAIQSASSIGVWLNSTGGSRR